MFVFNRIGTLNYDESFDFLEPVINLEVEDDKKELETYAAHQILRVPKRCIASLIYVL